MPQDGQKQTILKRKKLTNRYKENNEQSAKRRDKSIRELIREANRSQQKKETLEEALEA